MTDLVKDLREEHGNPLEWSAIKRLEERCAKAADAIERLEAERESWEQLSNKYADEINACQKKLAEMHALDGTAEKAILALNGKLAEANESADKFCEQSLRDLGAAAKLEEQLAEAQARLGGICCYPMCDCKGDGCQVLDGPVPAVCARSDLAEARAEIERKGDALVKARDQFRKYESLHRAKLTVGGAQKAETNKAMAEMCDDALAAQQQALEASDDT